MPVVRQADLLKSAISADFNKFICLFHTRHINSSEPKITQISHRIISNAFKFAARDGVIRVFIWGAAWQGVFAHPHDFEEREK